VRGVTMANIDELKKKAEEGLRTLKETAQDLAFNLEKQATIGKKKYVDITKIERDVQRLFVDIGEYVYDEFTSGRDLSKDDQFLRDKTAAISRMRLQINDIEREIEEIRHTRPPKREAP
jgi:hypothetical protein